MRPSLSSTNSPTKRLKFAEPIQFLSSSSLVDKLSNDRTTVETPQENTSSCQKLSSLAIEKVSNFQDDSVTKGVSIYTPPPSPKVKPSNKLDDLNKLKSKLLAEDNNLDLEVNMKIKEITGLIVEIDTRRAAKFKYDDYASILKRSMKEIRDHFNGIFLPGNKLAQTFELMMKEMHTRHNRKFEKKCLEWNSDMDHTENAILKKVEDLNHEIELHRRTLDHQEHLSKIDEQFNDASNEVVSVDKDTEMSPSPDRSEKVPVNLDDNIQGYLNDDCVILDHSEDTNAAQGDIETQQSNANSDSKTEVLDGDETDVDDNNDEDSRSFTPCQAQRVG